MLRTKKLVADPEAKHTYIREHRRERTRSQDMETACSKISTTSTSMSQESGKVSADETSILMSSSIEVRTTPTSIEILTPDDFHHHVRDGEYMRDVISHASTRFHRILVMPNLKPPIIRPNQAQRYYDEILAVTPQAIMKDFFPLMTLYLTNSTTIDDIIDAKASGIIVACKLYPAGATTNSDDGVTNLRMLTSVFDVSFLHLLLVMTSLSIENGGSWFDIVCSRLVSLNSLTRDLIIIEFTCM